MSRNSLRAGCALVLLASALAPMQLSETVAASGTANTWSTIRSLPAGRAYVGAASSSSDNRIYVYDGQTSSGYSGAITAFTPGGSSWSTLTSDASPAAAVGATTTSDGKLWTLGGTNGNPVNKAQYFTPGSNTWTNITNMPTARGYLGAAVGSDGRAYAIGGKTNTTYLSTVEAYDPTVSKWYCSGSGTGCTSTSTPPVAMPTARAHLAVLADSSGHIYAIGGQTATSTYTNVVEMYNPSTRTWTCSTGDTGSGCSSTSLAPMPTVRTAQAAFSSNGLLYVIGGYNGSYLNYVEVYNPTSNTWECSTGDTGSGCSASPLTAMPTARAYLGLVTASDGNVYALGGYNGSYLTTVEAYGPLTVPAAPTGVSATAGDGTAIVNWTAPANTGGSPITGYTVTCSPSCTGATVGSGTTSSTITGLTDGTSYTFNVTASNFVGTGSAGTSNAVTPACNTSTGSLTISGAGLGNFNVTLNGSDQQVYTSLGSYTATNTTCSGWNVTFQASQFQSAGGDTFPANSIQMPQPTVSNCTSGCGTGTHANPPNICIHSSSVPVDGGSAVTVASAATNTGQGTYTFTPGTIGSGNVQLTVPSYAYATTYSSTLTVSIIQGPSAGC